VGLHQVPNLAIGLALPCAVDPANPQARVVDSGTPSLVDGDPLQVDPTPDTLANVAASYTAKPVTI
jgi:hypothetical protein